MHLRISKVDVGENRTYKLGEFDKKFVNIVQMVHHYSINRLTFTNTFVYVNQDAVISYNFVIVNFFRLPIKGAEHMCLLTPVTEELL